MSNRSKRRSIAAETVEILERGSYLDPQGKAVTIDACLRHAVSETRHYAPEDFPAVLAARDELLDRGPAPTGTKFQVVNGTTLAAARSLLDDDPTSRVMCLNFASAKNPGGGFLGGSQAQEESLARASGLYACINGVNAYYDTNRACGTCLYTDHMIYSPDVPVFRDDRDQLLAAPYPVSFITAPAVNAGALAANQPQQVPKIAETMLQRIERLLAVAIVHQHRSIVLGAWGCGVFKNKPGDVAGWFAEQLEPVARRAFDRVVFAVLDHTDGLGTLRPFVERFEEAR